MCYPTSSSTRYYIHCLKRPLSALDSKESVLFRFLSSFPISLPLFSPFLSLSTKDRYVSQSDRHARRTGTSSASSIQQKGGTQAHTARKYGVFRMRMKTCIRGPGTKIYTQDGMNRMMKWQMSGCSSFSPFLSFFSGFIFSELAFAWRWRINRFAKM